MTPDVASTTRLRSRFLRYSGVSVLAMALAQGGLAVGYGVLSWPVFASVMLSLAVSIVPSYVLNRWLVWPRGDASQFRQATAFLLIAVAGSLATFVLVALAVRVGHAISRDHLFLTLVVNGTAVVATGAVWLARFWLLDRVVFRGSVTSSWTGSTTQMASAQ
jgi:putative flippase GtrA